MTPAHCEKQLGRLSILKGLPEDVVEFFAALEDIPDERFTLAVSRALKTRTWFPTPAELRADCDAVGTAPPHLAEPQFVELLGGGRDVVIPNPLPGGTPLHLHVTRDWKLDCDVCADTGWQPHACPAEPCGRRFVHAPHEHVTRCECLSWNPTLQRRRDATAKYATPPEKVSA